MYIQLICILQSDTSQSGPYFHRGFFNFIIMKVILIGEILDTEAIRSISLINYKRSAPGFFVHYFNNNLRWIEERQCIDEGKTIEKVHADLIATWSNNQSKIPDMGK